MRVRRVCVSCVLVAGAQHARLQGLQGLYPGEKGGVPDATVVPMAHTKSIASSSRGSGLRAMARPLWAACTATQPEESYRHAQHIATNCVVLAAGYRRTTTVLSLEAAASTQKRQKERNRLLSIYLPPGSLQRKQIATATAARATTAPSTHTHTHAPPPRAAERDRRNSRAGRLAPETEVGTDFGVCVAIK